MTEQRPSYELDGGGGQVLFHPSILGGGVLGINTVRGHIQSENYEAGEAGWRISGNGDTELNELDLRGDAQSDNYVAGTSGWFLGVDGTLEVNDGIFRGDLAAAGGTFSGNLSAAGGTFTGTLVGVDGTFSGTITGNQIVGGTITGVTVQSSLGSNRVVLNGGLHRLEFWSGGSMVGGLQPEPGGMGVVGNLVANTIRADGIGPPPGGSHFMISSTTVDITGFSGISMTGPITAYNSFSSSGNISGNIITGSKIASTNPTVTNAGLTVRWNVGEYVHESSSIAYKTNVRDLPPNTLDELLGLRAVIYDPKPGHEGLVDKNQKPVRGQHFDIYGFIAEEVATISPQMTAVDDEGEPAGIQWNGITVALVAAVQNLDARIKALESTNG